MLTSNKIPCFLQPPRTRLFDDGSPGITALGRLFLLAMLVVALFPVTSSAQIQGGSIQTLVWLDGDRDGVQDVGEPGLAGVTVFLYSCNGIVPLTSAVTGGNGIATFNGIAPGSYKMQYTLLPNMYYSYYDRPGDDDIDSDVRYDGFSPCFFLPAGGIVNHVDAGFQQCGPIGGLVCNGAAQFSVDPQTCGGAVLPEHILLGFYPCSNSFEVTLTTQDGQPVGNPVNANNIGQVLKASVRDPKSGQNCWGNIRIEYKLPPVITCTDVTLNCYNQTPPANTLAYYPRVSSCNPRVAVFARPDKVTDIPCAGHQFSSLYTRIVERTWVALDTTSTMFPMSDSCVQRFYFRRAGLGEVSMPSSVRLSCNYPFSPDQNGNPLPVGVFGAPSIGGLSLYNNANNNPCMFNAIYTDQIVPICEGSRKIIRSWRVVNWCTGAFRDTVQFIELLDDIPPTISCPSNVTISTAKNSCYGTISVPAPTVSDNCSNKWTLKLSASAGRIVLTDIVTDLPIGTHTLTWTATDPCGNTNSCSFRVTVRDDVPPTPVCDRQTVVTVGNDGDAWIYDETFDDGSHDNCGIRDFKVRRMVSSCTPSGTAYADSVRFTCCDVSTSPVMVELLVIDSSNNSASCMVEVYVQDKTPPIIVCPINVTVNCLTDRSDLSRYGKVVIGNQRRDTVFVGGQRIIDGVAMDNCNVSVTVSVDSFVDNCGIGYARRTWVAKDPGNLTASCQQLITIVNSNPYTRNDIIWPQDYITSNCTGSINPDSLPIVYGRPRIANTNKCGKILVSDPEDIVFPIAPPACFKIYRKWRVVDWCQYNPNVPNSPGFWEYTQELRVMDNVPPVFVNPPSSFTADITVSACLSTFSLPSATVSDCRPNIVPTVRLTNSSGSTVGTGYGPFTLPGGLYTATYTAEDGCGNVKTHTLTVNIRDRKKPTPIAIKGLATDLMPSVAMVTISAIRFNNGSYDNCTASDRLQFRLGRVGTPGQTNPPSTTELTFTCADLGTQKVDFWVGDESGNWDYVTTFIEIQNNMGANCPNGTGSTTAAVTGSIQTETGQGVDKTTVSTNIVNITPTVTSNDGSYSFTKVPLSSVLTVSPVRDADYLNGVSTLDLVYINRHILGVQPLGSPYKVIAADVNKSNSVTTLDIVNLRQLILQRISEFPNNKSWRFIEKNYQFPDASNPWTAVFPEICEMKPFDKNMKVDFVAVKVGDVTSDAKPNSLMQTQGRNATGTLTFDLNDQTLTAGQLCQVEFKARDLAKIMGYQFTLNFDKNALEFAEVKPGALKDCSVDNFGLSFAAEGALTTSWNGQAADLKGDETLFTLVFKAKNNGTLSEVLTAGSRFLHAEAYTTNEEMMDVALNFNSKTGKTARFELFQNQPNPFNKSTTIGFSLPEASTATLTVFDMAGRVVKTIGGSFAKGYNEFQLQREDLQGAGVLYYRLDTPNGSATKKMVVLE